MNCKKHLQYIFNVWGNFYFTRICHIIYFLNQKQVQKAGELDSTKKKIHTFFEYPNPIESEIPIQKLNYRSVFSGDNLIKNKKFVNNELMGIISNGPYSVVTILTKSILFARNMNYKYWGVFSVHCFFMKKRKIFC